MVLLVVLQEQFHVETLVVTLVWLTHEQLAKQEVTTVTTWVAAGPEFVLMMLLTVPFEVFVVVLVLVTLVVVLDPEEVLVEVLLMVGGAIRSSLDALVEVTVTQQSHYLKVVLPTVVVLKQKQFDWEMF